MTVRVLIGLAGVACLVVSAASVVRTLVIPRAQSSLLVRLVTRVIFGSVRALARRRPKYEQRDRLLAVAGPSMLLVVLGVWLSLFLVGWSTLLFAVAGGTLLEVVREAGSSLVTLGFASRGTPGATAIEFSAAATGLVTLGLLLAYLPTLYAAFNRREVLVTLLEGRAGVPAWGPEILARHQAVGIVDDLPAFYAQWEQRSADVAESHANYPALIAFRSPAPLRSWVVGLLAVCDAAALHLALQGDQAPSQARLCLRMGFTCLRTIADALRLPYNIDPSPDDPIDLTFNEFCEGIARLEETGFPMLRTAEEAWPHFRGWRVNYEQLAYRMADLTMAVPAPWSGVRSRLGEVEIKVRAPIDRRPGGQKRRGRPAPAPRRR